MRIMIVGAGGLGLPIIRYLSARGHVLTVIESDERRCKEVAERCDAAIFCGAGTDLGIWTKAEADKVDALLVLTNSDEVNTEICHIAKKQYGIPFIVSRVHHADDTEKTLEAGADVAICPSQETQRLFINAIESLSVETLYEHAATDFRIVKVVIPPNGRAIGKSTARVGVSDKCRIIGLFRNRELIYPERSFVFKGGDTVLLSGPPSSLEDIVEQLRSLEIT